MRSSSTHPSTSSGTTELEAALEQEDNYALQLGLPWATTRFLCVAQKSSQRHLGWTRPETCRVGEVREWIQGSFNVCILVLRPCLLAISWWRLENNWVIYAVSEKLGSVPQKATNLKPDQHMVEFSYLFCSLSLIAVYLITVMARQDSLSFVSTLL